MSSIRQVAISEPLVDVVDPAQVVSNNFLIKVRFYRLPDINLNSMFSKSISTQSQLMTFHL